MAAPLRTLVDDYSRYHQAFQLFLERSSEHQCMKDFIHGTLPDILARIESGQDTLNVMGVGSGAGEIDLEMLNQLHLKHPEAQLDNEVVEPCGDMIYKYKVLTSKTPGLEHITFRWNTMTASEFEKNWKERNAEKKMDFIHMIQMLYYVKDPEATVSFFRSLLKKNGKLLIILVSGESGWGRLWRTYKAELCNADISQCITTGDIRTFLDSKGISYQKHTLPSHMDITECFTEGDEKGELLLDFLTEVMDFSKSASPELKAGVLELLRHPDCSKEVDGRIVFNNNLEAVVLDP
ncbi:histamine N-methyltransferase [Astyanax mexicanus]|uniref:histamine N-methyltransferase n=1 Tax=Astyanax mexicanus TaxID=7994 RepID=UPI0020CB09B8|nr:histamine N-methyltransferase [Astyanax mexicanus]XP_049340655.1 histamine N-methyltransferase [Astyanax mexicanus]XP_049340656.1 histamine N-methyltransferase [Astyanax mexicanus]